MDLYNESVPILSIIIPAHNSGKTLGNTVKSIFIDVNKSLLNKIEILIVENGSVDDTLEVANKLSTQYPVVKLLRSEPKVANARNCGINHAKGDWLFFMDADDQMAKGGLEILLTDIANNNVDMVAYCFYSGKQRRILTNVCLKDDSFTKKAEMIANPTLYLQVWSKLFRKNVVDQNHLCFDNRLNVAEDSDFTIQFLQVCGTLMLSNQLVYCYSLNPGSIMHTDPSKKLPNYCLAMKVTEKKLCTANPVLYNAFPQYAMMHFNIAMVRGVFYHTWKLSFFERVKKMKSAITDSVFQNSLNKIKIENCKSAGMLPILFLKLHCYSIAGCIYAIRAKMNYKRDLQAEVHCA